MDERLNLAGPDDELKELGDTIDSLLGRLERSFQFERQFVANAAHELRTPLATMRASLDVAMAKPDPAPQQTVMLADTAVEGHVARLVVDNGGPVVAQDDVRDLAQPFRRLGADRTHSDQGIGLGLSIVESIADAHGGAVELSARPDGGLRVVVTLPLLVQSTPGAGA